MRIAVLVLSQSGLAHARRLRETLGERVTIFGPSCVVGSCRAPVFEKASADASTAASPAVFRTDEPGLCGWVGPLRKIVPEVWAAHDGIVAIMALGIVTRLLGPLANDKRRDPAVVAVDDAARFAISVLGGHGASANELAGSVASILGAMPVITTASDVHGVPAVDRIGRTLGWVIERTENMTRVAAAVVRRQPVAVWQDAGAHDWWRPFGPWPEHFVRIRDGDQLRAFRPAAVLVISDRALPDGLPDAQTLVYRPPTLVAGIGCRRGTAGTALNEWADAVFKRNGLASASLAAVATVTLKVDEPGLLEFASGRGVPLVAFPADQLRDQPGIETPSERVRDKVGIPGVAEPAALRAAGAGHLLVKKQKGPGMTLAVARKPDLDPIHHA